VTGTTRDKPAGNYYMRARYGKVGNDCPCVSLLIGFGAGDALVHPKAPVRPSPDVADLASSVTRQEPVSSAFPFRFNDMPEWWCES
jgi:hypothetical protein